MLTSVGLRPSPSPTLGASGGRALRMAGRAEGGGGAGVGEYVGVLGEDVGAGVHVLRGAGCAGAGADAGGAVADVLDGGERAVFFGADFELLAGVRAVADAE